MASKKQQLAKKGKKGKGKAEAKASGEVRVAEHPRARRQIALAKSYAGLGAFALVAWSSYSGGAQFVDVVGRSLLWGMTAYLVVWAIAVHMWRQIAIAEVRAAERRWKEQKEAEEEQIAKLTRVLEENGMPTTGTGAMPNL
jgi:hypothetical protein